MKLKRLILQGFKSFKDRTTIHFDDGITGIVGPNGCGKSNVVDALFWVMGEQSAKHLRGSSMKDVIFAGSSKYSPAAWAEVTLVLENSEGKHIHIANKVSSPSEIQLTRKLYRNSETEYRINNEPCRLKDIQEVFMDTGAGAKSYSIIAQGEINRLVQAKPEERRVMIEEVAGITKFKLRKRESLKKIELTQANLGRLNDLQLEIEKNLKSLEKQAEKAERARALKDKVKRNDLVVHSHKVFDLLKDLKEFGQQINERTVEIENIQLRKQTLEISLQDERIQKEDMIEQIDELQKAYNEVSRQLAASEERLNSLCQSQTDKEKQVNDKEKELQEMKLELENRSQRLAELLGQREEMESREDEQQDFSDLEEVVEELKAQVEIKKELVHEVQAELTQIRNELQSVDQTIFRNTSRLEEFAANLQDLTKEIEALESQYSSVSGEISKERDEVKNSEQKTKALEAKEQELKVILEEKSQAQKQRERELKDKTREFIQVESRLQSLKEVNDSFEDIKVDTANFLSEVKADGHFELLGNLVRCEDQYTKAVQKLLGELMNMIIGKNNDATSLMNWLNSDAARGIDLLDPPGGEVSLEEITQQETLQRLEVMGLSNVVPLVSVVEIQDAGFKQRILPLFRGLYIVDSMDINQFTKLAHEIKFRGIASLDGRALVKNSNGVKQLSLSQEGEGEHGRLARNNKIQVLQSELEVVQKAVAELEVVVAQQETEIDAMTSEYKNVQSAYSEARANFAAKKSALDSKLANMETGQSRLEILKNRKNETSKQRLELLEKEDEIASRQKELNASADLKQGILDEAVVALEDLRSSYDEKREELVHKQVEARSFQERLGNLVSQTEDVQNQTERLAQKITNNIESIKKINEEIQAIETELGTLETRNKETATSLGDQEEVLGIRKDSLAQLLQGMQEREDEAKQLVSKMNKFEKEIVEKQAKLEQLLIEEEQITRDIFEKYQVDLREVVGTHLEYSSDDLAALRNLSNMYVMESETGTVTIAKMEYQFNRRYGQDLKDCAVKLKEARQELQRLGEINWQAIEDYERQKLRYDFLKIQEEELKKSLTDLQTAISHIDEKSKERFKVAFEEVNVRFQKVFPIIFGGGSAKLEVKGDVNDIDCGVDIIAQPPGKKMQNINLMSGGEKALTAVSLIFSIFLVKPSPFCLLDEVDAPLDDANVGRFNELLREMSEESQFILITHNKKTMELNDTLYGVTMQEPGISKAVSVQLH